MGFASRSRSVRACHRLLAGLLAGGLGAGLGGCLADAPQAPFRASATTTYTRLTPGPAPGEGAPGDMPASGPVLTVPVAGVRPEAVPDSFRAPRSGGRIHEATDILAPRGTPVVSADDGELVKIGQNRFGGNVLYATDTTGRYVYYYAHLDGFAPGLSIGQPLRRGAVLGYVGTTGNAPPGTPHLHFQLMLRPEASVGGRGGSVHGGQPIDARPFFVYPGAAPLSSTPQPVALLP